MKHYVDYRLLSVTWIITLAQFAHAEVLIEMRIRNAETPLNESVLNEELQSQNVTVAANIGSQEAGLWIGSEVCSPGTFAGPNATSCSNCAIGSAVNVSGASECPLCTKGHWIDHEAALACNTCALNTYQDEEGSSGCKTCPTHSLSNEAAPDIEDCICVSTFFRTRNVLLPILMITQLALSASASVNVPHVNCA